MTGPEEIEVSVWRKSNTSGWRKMATVGTWTALEFSPWHNAAGPWVLEMPWNAQAKAFAKSRVVTFDFRGQRFTGLIEDFATKTDESGKPVLVVSGVDALALLGDLLITPTTPTVAASGPTSFSVARYRATGPAENVLSSLIRSQVQRVGMPVTVAPSLGRGGSTILSERFSNLLRVVTRKAQVAGLGVRCGLAQATSGTHAEMTVSFVKPVDRSQRVRLSHKVGTLRSWEQHDAIPTATRAWVGGDGKGVNRDFFEVRANDLGFPGIEGEWSRVRETFVDARGATTDDAGAVLASEVVAALKAKGVEALTEALGQSSFALETSEAAGMRAFEHYNVGDSVLVELVTDVSRVVQLGAIRVTADMGGVTVQPVPGNPDGGDPLFKQADYLSTIRAQVRSLEREEA